MAHRIQTALVETVHPPAWAVHVVGSDRSRVFERREDAEAYAQNLAWTRTGRQRIRRLLKRTGP